MTAGREPNGLPPGSRRPRVPVLTPAGVLVLLVSVAVLASLLVSGPGNSGSGAVTAVTTPTLPARTRVPAETPAVADLTAVEVERWLGLAETLARQSRIEESIAIYQELLRRTPQDARVEAGWARALLWDGQGEQALIHARKAVELDPVRVETAVSLARADLATANVERGVAMAENAVELDPASAAAHAVLAEAYWRDGQLRKAEQEASRAVELNGDSAEARRIRGLLYQAVDNDPQRAVQELRAAVQLEPELWRWHYELGLMLLQTGDAQAAVDALMQALALRPKAEIYTALGEGYLGLEQPREALTVLMAAQAEGDGADHSAALLAAAYAWQGRCVEARTYYEQVLARAPDDRWAQEAQQRCEAPSLPLGTLAQTPPTRTPAPATAEAGAAGLPPLSGWIAFPLWNTETGKYDTYVSRPDGAERRLVLTEAQQPSFRPDGEWLAVNSDRSLQENLLLVRPDGSQMFEVTRHAEDGLPDWSSDGQRLAYSSTQHGDRQSRLYVLDPVPLDGSKEEGRALQAGQSDATGSFPTWTAEGSVIYSGCDYTAAPVQCGLLLLSAEPGPQLPLRLTDHPSDTAPAAAGNWIAFMSVRDGNWEVYRVRTDGSGLQRLTYGGPVVNGLPAWSQDGRTIAFVSDEGGVWAAWAMNADGSGRRKLFDLGGSLGENWPQQKISWGP